MGHVRGHLARQQTSSPGRVVARSELGPGLPSMLCLCMALLPCSAMRVCQRSAQRRSCETQELEAVRSSEPCGGLGRHVLARTPAGAGAASAIRSLFL